MEQSTDQNQQRPQLFSDVQYAVIDLPLLQFEDPGYIESIQQLDEHGATRVALDEHQRIRDVRELTHVVSRTVDFPDYDLAYANFLHVVKPTWIQHSIVKNKQQNPRQFSPDPRYFLHDAIVSCADIPEGDKEAIQGGVIAMGGLYSESLTKLVTHLIALQPEDPKVAAAVERNLKCQVVLPHWFDDCLRLRRRISERPYTLPDPELLRSNSDPPTPRNNRDIITAISSTPENVPSPTEKATVFHSKIVMLSQDLGLGQRTRQVIEDIITSGHGSITDNVAKCTMFISQYREGEDFMAAAKAKKDIGNLSWLYHLIIHNRWTNPMLRLLHYPLPSRGIPGFEDFKISVSNYTGHARQYLENLVKASGATFTKTMVQNNTHLITAHTGSEKCEAAKEWNIHIINHLWLEDSYAQNKVQSLTVSRYTHFPSRTNLGEVVGQTPIDRDAIGRYFLGQSESASEPASQSSSGDDVVHQVQVIPPKRKSNPLTTPSMHDRFDDKENMIPDTVHGSRASKAKAMSKIHNAAADIALYEKEKKRVGGVVHGRERGGRNSSTGTTPQSNKKTPKESPKRPASDEESDDDISTTAKPIKKAKRDSSEAPILKVLVTLYPRWTNNETREQADKAKLRTLGIHIIKSPAPDGNFIVCAPKIARTEKFVCALAYGPQVLTTEFLDHCIDHKEIPEYDDFHLQDAEGESRLDMSLNESISRAKENDRRLLESWQIFCTEKVQTGFNTIKNIVEANGGSCCMFRSKTVMSVSKDQLHGKEEGELYLISGSSGVEKSCWEPFVKMARKAEMIPRIVKTDWLLNLAMTQEIAWNDDWGHQPPK